MARFDLTYRKARGIQYDQYVFYCRGLSDYGRSELMRRLMADTLPCDNWDVERSIFQINDMVPRGGWFEHEEIMNLMFIDRYHGKYRLDFVTGI